MSAMDVVNRCWRCGKKIHEPLSIYTGMGPICRKATGLVEAHGWQALEHVRWWREDRYALYDRLVAEIGQELQWWRMRLALVVPGSERLFEGALNAVEGLQHTSPAAGLVVMGHLWRLVGQVRFVLEPTLMTLRNAGSVEATWVEGVPELRRTLQNAEAILCGLGAREDAVELAAVRTRDRAALMSDAVVVPAAGIE